MQLSLSEFELFEFFHLTDDNFIICSGTNFRSIIKTINRSQQALETLTKIINSLGERSATSQGLKQVITNLTKFSGTSQRIYIKLEGSKAMGFLKTGEKRLFYRDLLGNIEEIQPTCILDIYVCESCQRSGYGKQIFQKFLQFEKLRPEKLAYDRPSPKLISFLKKHYSLSEFIPQNNNYVIFNSYFSSNIQTARTNKEVLNFHEYHQNMGYNRNYRQSPQKKEGINSQSNKFDSKNTMKVEKRIIDSLQTYTEQMDKIKQRTRTPLINLPNKLEHVPYRTYIQKINVSNNNMNSKLNPLQMKWKYSLNMKLNDLSYRVPWGTEALSSKTIFTTSSHTYGSYYQY